MPDPVNLLLTGSPGVGKTTLVQKIVDKLGKDACGGFITRELREAGRRVGFELESLDGKRGILAHVNGPGRPRVGRYGVDVEVVDEVGVAAIEESLDKGRFVVIDEIGKMELFSEAFRRAVFKALEAPNRTLATIMERSNDFADKLKDRPDVELIRVSLSNRDELVDRILDKL